MFWYVKISFATFVDNGKQQKEWKAIEYTSYYYRIKSCNMYCSWSKDVDDLCLLSYVSGLLYCKNICLNTPTAWCTKYYGPNVISTNSINDLDCKSEVLNEVLWQDLDIFSKHTKFILKTSKTYLFSENLTD